MCRSHLDNEYHKYTADDVMSRKCQKAIFLSAMFGGRVIILLTAFQRRHGHYHVAVAMGARGGEGQTTPPLVLRPHGSRLIITSKQ
jgi:hypothetical protein